MVGNGLEAADRSGFTIAYQPQRPNLIHHLDGRFRRLPNITGSCARGADPIGRFGLVYQRLPISGSGSTPAVCDLYQSLPPRRHNSHGPRLIG
jgi:hypothetical protein